MSSQLSRLVILVGHGGVPRDFPREKVRRLMLLESQRRSHALPAGAEEIELDDEIRSHPRSPETDPYKFGLEQLAAALRKRLPGPLRVAYNEFCAPSVPQAVERAAADGASEIVLLTSMMTPGGSHSEEEIPELIHELRAKYPSLTIRYAWPFDMDALAGFLIEHLDRFARK
jgi:sirohydrochlorin cobaltochelatase